MHKGSGPTERGAQFMPENNTFMEWGSFFFLAQIRKTSKIVL